MSASSKFDFTSGSPDRPPFASGLRGSHGANTMDGSVSLHENMENPLLSNLPNMTRSSSSVMRGDVLNFFQCLRFDPKSVVVKHKLNRPSEFRRLSSAAVGIPLEDSPPSSSKSKQQSSFSLEDLRQLKAGARESGTKARERVKILNDCLLAINKCFPTIPSRKRSRLDALSNTLLANDRSFSGMSLSKPGSQKYTSTSGFEPDHRKSEEKAKNAITSKRTRTSMVDKMDLRTNNAVRPSGTFDKDRDVVRLSNCSAIQGEDQTLSVSVGNWEKSKTKKKRTNIKLDASVSLPTTRIEGYGEPKQGMRHQISTEARSRLIDAHGFRSATSNGGVGVGKAEAAFQMNSASRLSISVTDSGNSSTVHERRDHSNVQEKAGNKANSREDFSSGSPTSGSKLTANVRAPRTGVTGGVSKLSQVVHSPSSNDWELSNCTSKASGLLVTNNRKNTPSTQSSSPSVVNWVQRPQKISRTARRTNLLPIISGNDESTVIDATPDPVANERRFPVNSPKQIKIKNEKFSPAALSESEESGATEVKLKNKKKKGSEIVKISGQNVQKMSTLLLPPKKNNSREDHGDGIRRQGRSGRVVTSSRSLLSLPGQKIGSVGTTKQIRSSRLGLNKNERSGLPPSRKLSDRKSYTRQKHTSVHTAADLFVGSDDGHEELLAAIKSVTDTVCACSSPFWKKMEPLFRFICDADISFLKEKVNLGSVVDMSVPDLLDADSSTFQPSCNEFEREEIDMRNVEISPEHSMSGAKSANEISLYQRLIAALIPEANEELFDCGELKYDPYGTRFVENDMEPNVVLTSRDSGYDHLQHGLIADQLMSGTTCSEYQYHNLPMNGRLLMEVRSIGVYPDLGSDLVQSGDEISENICVLLEKYQEQVTKNNGLHGKLLNYVSEAKELQEKDFESRALDKLASMAYEKYMCCWGPNVHGMKSATGKKAKQAALTFVKRALKLYKEFEATGKSCFNEPIYRETFISGASRVVDAEITDDDSDKLRATKSGCSMEVRTPASLGMPQSPSFNNQEMYSSPNVASEKEDGWSNRVKSRELSINDVGGTIRTNAKGKRSERDREGKGRDLLSRSGNTNTKSGRPISTTVKGDRKSKAKPKQKTAHHLYAPLEEMYNKPNVESGNKDKNGYDPDSLEEPIDLSGLQLPDMEGLGDPSGSNGQGEDIGSWFNFEDEGLQDQDYMGGLGIPMDDLADLNMMV